MHSPHSGVSAMIQVSGYRVQGAGFRVQGSGFRVQGAGFRVQGSGCRVQGAGFRVQGSGCRVHAQNIHSLHSGVSASSHRPRVDARQSQKSFREFTGELTSEVNAHYLSRSQWLQLLTRMHSPHSGVSANSQGVSAWST